VSPPPSNRLLLPLIAVSTLCVIEAIVIAFLLGRGPAAPPAPALSNAANPAPQPDAAPPRAAAANSSSPAAISRGKLAQRIDAGGITMTALAVSNQPRFKELFTPSPEQKFIDLEILIENNTARPFAYYTNQFTIKDDKDRPFSSTTLGAADPALTWATLVPGEKARGHLAFVLPKTATGLTLTYPVTDSSAIHIDLGQ
jgi:hypothetical protein